MNDAAAPVQLARLHGADARGMHGRPLGRLHGITLLLRPAVHAFWGHAEDGSVALAELLAGRRKPRAGAVLMLGREPSRSAAIRARIGSLLDQPDLPPCTTVGRAVDWVGRLRANRTATDPLEPWGLSSWRPRPLASLRRDEARAIELALALATPDPVALILYEPFRDVAAIDHGVLRRALSELAADGCTVVLISDALHPMDEVANHLHRLERGRLAVDGEAPGWPAITGGELLIWLEGDDREAAVALAASLGERSELAAVGWRQHGEQGQHGRQGALVVSVQAADLDRATLVIAETVSRDGVRIAALESSRAEAQSAGGEVT